MHAANGRQKRQGMGTWFNRTRGVCGDLLVGATGRAEDLEAEVLGDNGQKLGVGRPLGALFGGKEGFEMPIAMAPAIADDGADAALNSIAGNAIFRTHQGIDFGGDVLQGRWVLNGNDQGRGEIIESFVLWR